MGLHVGSRVDVVLRGGVIVVVPEHAQISPVQRDGGLVAVAVGEMPPLTVEAVREAMDAARR